MARDEDVLVLGEQVPDQVRDRVALSGPGRSLDDHRSGVGEPLDHRFLLGVGMFGEQHVGGCVALAIGAPGLDADDPKQGFGELFGPGERVDERGEVLREALIAPAEEEVRLAVDVDTARAADGFLALEELALRPEALHDVLQERARRPSIEGMEVLGVECLRHRLDGAAIESDVPEQRRVELRVVFGVDDGELGERWIEAQADALEQQRVGDGAALVIHHEDAVGEIELILLRLAFEARVQVEQIGEHRERVHVLVHPALPTALVREPVLEGVDPLLGVLEALRATSDAERLANDGVGLGAEAFPARLEPVLEDDRGFGALGLVGASHLDDELAPAAVGLGAGHLARRRVPTPHVRRLRKRVEAKRPLALVEPHDGRRLRAVHLLEVLEDPADPVLRERDVVGCGHLILFRQGRGGVEGVLTVTLDRRRPPHRPARLPQRSTFVTPVDGKAAPRSRGAAPRGSPCRRREPRALRCPYFPAGTLTSGCRTGLPRRGCPAHLPGAGSRRGRRLASTASRPRPSRCDLRRGS